MKPESFSGNRSTEPIGLAQDLHFDYDRSAHFNDYRTYRWIDYKPVAPGDQLLDQDIKRAVDEQLAGKACAASRPAVTF